jgi:thioredoxin 1
MASANVVEFTTENWQTEVLQSDVPVLVDFWAPWCGPCRMLGPTIDRIADQYAGKIKVGKLNTDDNQDVAINYGINTIPQVFLFNKSDRPAERFVGVQPESTYTKAINRLLEPK